LEEKRTRRKEWGDKNREEINASARERNLKNRDSYLKYHSEYNKPWYQKNKEKHDARGKLWVKNNPEKAKAIKDRFLKAHPEEIKAFFKKYEQKPNAKFRMVKHSAKQRNYEFALSLENFSEIILKPCTYCGENEKRIGVDRIDNTKGYTVENSNPCCTTCNMMKKVMTVSEFLSHIKKIYNYNAERGLYNSETSQKV
jgi:hypothetical protein